jgi:hypothetical protein
MRIEVWHQPESDRAGFSLQVESAFVQKCLQM